VGHILIVEDDTGIREAVVDLLSDAECRITSVADGDAAKVVLATGDVELVILDLMMPGCSGWELLIWMRAQASLVSTPVVITSALAAPANRLGAQAYLQKPYGSRVLLKTIERLLGRELRFREQAAEDVRTDAQASSPTPEEPLLRVLIVEDDAGIREAITDTLEPQGFGTRSAANGEAALHLLQDPACGIDVIVLDLMMPGCNGWQFLTRLRSQDAGRWIPVVVVSAVPPRADALDVQGYVQKPFHLDTLVDTIRSAAALP
jgi:DNA-binding response OmpR family regulator